jgi:LysM repeat protein
MSRTNFTTSKTNGKILSVRKCKLGGLLMEKRTDYRRKMALRARKQRYAKVMVLSSFGIVGASLIGATQVHAEEWVANTPESIQLTEGSTSYTMKRGDTLWAIATRININVETLAQANNIDLASGQQYHLAVGTVISWTDKVVTATDVNGTVIGQAPITESSKIVKDKAVGENVQQDVVNGNATDTDVQGGSNQTGGNTSNGGNTDNGGSQGGGQPGGNEGNGGNGGGETPTDPVNPTDPEKPVEPTDPETPVDPEKPVEPTDPTDPEKPTQPTNEDRYVTVDVDENGVSIASTDGYTFQFESTSKGVETLPNGNTITTYTTTRVWKKDAVTPPENTHYVGQVLYSKGGFATMDEADAHINEIEDQWFAYAFANNIAVSPSWSGSAGNYTVTVTVTAINVN